MSNEKALTKSGPRELAENESLKALAGRISACVPGGKKLTTSEALALAAISEATGLSPFTGEIFYLPGIGPHVGIEGARRRAKEQGNYTGKARPMTPDENKAHAIRDGDIGSVYELFRLDLLRETIELNRLAGEIIIPVLPVLGVGIFRKGDTIQKGKSGKCVADRRAEKAALNAAYDIGVPIYMRGEPSGDAPGWQVVNGESQAEPAPQWPERPWDALTLKTWCAAEVAGYEGKYGASERQQKFANVSLGKVEKDSTKRKSIRLFLFGKEKGLTPAEYHAIIEWIGATPENGYTPSPHVAQEIQAVLNEYRKEKGQQEMALNGEQVDGPKPGDAPQSVEELYQWAADMGIDNDEADRRIWQSKRIPTVGEAFKTGWDIATLWQFVVKPLDLDAMEPPPPPPDDGYEPPFP